MRPTACTGVLPPQEHFWASTLEAHCRLTIRLTCGEQARLAEKDGQVRDLVKQLSSLLEASNSLKRQNTVLTRMLQLGNRRSADKQPPCQPAQPDHMQHPGAAATQNRA